MSTHQSLYAAPGHPGAEPLFMPGDHQQAKTIKLSRTQYFCPTLLGGCGAPMLVAYNWKGYEAGGQINQPHFRHERGADPCDIGNAETHRRIQELIRDHFQSQGHTVTLEYYSRETRTRADIYITGGSLGQRSVSLEVQLSPLEHSLYVERTRKYKQGADVVQWLFARDTRQREGIVEQCGYAIAPHHSLGDDRVRLELIHPLAEDRITELEDWRIESQGLWCDRLETLELHRQREEQFSDSPASSDSSASDWHLDDPVPQIDPHKERAARLEELRYHSQIALEFTAIGLELGDARMQEDARKNLEGFLKMGDAILIDSTSQEVLESVQRRAESSEGKDLIADLREHCEEVWAGCLDLYLDGKPRAAKTLMTKECPDHHARLYGYPGTAVMLMDFSSKCNAILSRNRSQSQRDAREQLQPWVERVRQSSGSTLQVRDQLDDIPLGVMRTAGFRNKLKFIQAVRANTGPHSNHPLPGQSE